MHYAAVRREAELNGGTLGIPTGFDFIDSAYVTGMAPGHLIVVIGYPGRGKRIDVNANVATPDGLVHYFTHATGNVFLF